MDNEKDLTVENEDIVTLIDDEGVETDCYEVAFIKLDNKSYSILQPVELLDGMEEDEALVFEVTDNNGEESFEMVLDDDIIDKVFDEYNKLLDNEE